MPTTRTNDLTDQDPMPFGKYKGEKMEDVPAGYLHWLWVNFKGKDRYCAVGRYIKDNMAALAKEYPDGIWE